MLPQVMGYPNALSNTTDGTRSTDTLYTPPSCTSLGISKYNSPSASTLETRPYGSYGGHPSSSGTFGRRDAAASGSWQPPRHSSFRTQQAPSYTAVRGESSRSDSADSWLSRAPTNIASSSRPDPSKSSTPRNGWGSSCSSRHTSTSSSTAGYGASPTDESPTDELHNGAGQASKSSEEKQRSAAIHHAACEGLRGLAVQSAPDSPCGLVVNRGVDMTRKAAKAVETHAVKELSCPASAPRARPAAASVKGRKHTEN